MKKIISVFLILCMLLSLTTAFAGRYSDVPDGAAYKTAIENLSNYGIVSGYGGAFNPGGSITRAEAAKIAAVVSGIDDEATAKKGVKKFSDVEIGHWSCGYVNAVADKGYILGYPNGNFMPNNQITFAEMTTIVLRLLGYNAEVLGDNWPYAYMVKAGELGITDGVILGDFDIINRAQTCQIIDNALKETIYGSGETLSAKVSGLKYSDPVVITSEDVYVSLKVLGITRENQGEYTVIRDGKASAISQIELYDVVYKSESNKTIYVYCDKISGVYREAYPTKADIVQAEISGNVLDIETQTAKDKLGEKSNSYKLNSRITVLIGKDGGIVDVVDLGSVGNSEYGVLLSIEKMIDDSVYDKGEGKTYLNILSGDGKSVSYETRKDYNNFIGTVGKISFDSEGYAQFSRETNRSKLEGVVDKSKKKIGNYYLTSDATIVELVYAPADNRGDAVATVIDMEDISIDKVYDTNVVYALETGEFKDISFVVLKDVSNNGYTYGVLTDCNISSRGMSVSGSYKVITNGVEKSYNSSFGVAIEKGMPVAMIIGGGSLNSISPLKSASRGKLEAIDSLRIKIGSTIYELAENIQIYKHTIGMGYKSLSVNQAKEYIGYTTAVYTDAKTIKGGMGRVIIITD